MRTNIKFLNYDKYKLNDNHNKFYIAIVIENLIPIAFKCGRSI